ncbi:hypothetical protein F751_5807 [Auxenochlorella protothecoides]|uniref:Uncharacterized protein n=1 Tax=Auxenochlorella protothecoides TaxID=3075 RepID=A0A087SDE6_AUXPR|nr:hypothetical protein F751_5807 [Auxenochlorella protothecoides]KFM23750.1 hypothetical protein F751_5807 [Auxenochlorella protothecoides]
MRQATSWNSRASSRPWMESAREACARTASAPSRRLVSTVSSAGLAHSLA